MLNLEANLYLSIHIKTTIEVDKTFFYLRKESTICGVCTHQINFPHSLVMLISSYRVQKRLIRGRI